MPNGDDVPLAAASITTSRSFQFQPSTLEQARVLELYEELMRVPLQSMQAITAPEEPGVYVIFKGSKTIKVGVANSSLRARLRSHPSGPLAWRQPNGAGLSKCKYRYLAVPGGEAIKSASGWRGSRRAFCALTSLALKRGTHADLMPRWVAEPRCWLASMVSA
jgi:hypothetical protein